MSCFESPFLAVPASNWPSSNDLAFAIFDSLPASAGHVFAIAGRIVETWFDATNAEQAALMALIKGNLPLRRGWFDKNARVSGTNYQVAFTQSETGWPSNPSPPPPLT